MALVVENGTGLSNANSYLSLDDANSYAAAHGNSSTWSAATDAEKEEALRLAAQYLDLKYGSRFVGLKGSRDQALGWPRSGVVDSQGYSYTSSEIPLCLKQAQVEAALRHLEGDELLGVIDEPGTIKSEAVKVGSIEESKEYVGGKSQVKKYPKIESLLRSILYDTDQVGRG